MNKVHINNDLYYSGVFEHMRYENIIKLLHNEYGMDYISSVRSSDSNHYNLRCFEIVDQSKFTLFVLKYSEYIYSILK
jgi:hypothetical protein